MSLLDPRSGEISLLRELVSHKDAEILYLRSQIAELQRMNICLTNQHAARLLGYSAEVPPSPPTSTSEGNPMTLRNTEAPIPTFSTKDLAKKLDPTLAD